MFYSHEVLTSRKYGVATVWLVATLGSKSNSKKINRSAILGVDVPKACQTIIDPAAPMALRLQGNLLYGVSRVYMQQCGYVLVDAEKAQQSLRMMVKAAKDGALDPDAGKTRPEQLLLQDDPSFLPDLTLPPLDLIADLGLTLPEQTNRSGESQSLTPFASQLQGDHGTPEGPMGGLVIPSSSSAAPGEFLLQGEDEVGSMRAASILGGGMSELLQEPEFAFDDDGNMIDIPQRQPIIGTHNAPLISRRLSAASMSGQVSAALQEGQQDDAEPVMDPMDLDFPQLEAPEEDHPNPQADDLDGKIADTANAAAESSSSFVEAPMQRRQRAPKLIPADTTMELRNKDLSDWNSNYVTNMKDAARIKKTNRAITQAKKNAEHWVWGTGIGGHGNPPFGGGTPFDKLYGDNLFKLFTGYNRKTLTGTKRDRDSGIDEYTQAEARRIRQRVEEEQIGRAEEDEGMYEPDEEVELPREAPSALDDQHLFSAMPWNMSASGRGSSAIPRSGTGPGPQGSLRHRGGRMVSASPLHGRGQAGGLEALRSLTGEDEFGNLGPEDFDMGPSSDGFELEPLAPTQPPTRVREALSAEGENFITFVADAIAIKKAQHETRAERSSEMPDDADEVLFVDLLPPTENNNIVASQALMMVLALGTKGLLHVRQDVGFGDIGLSLTSDILSLQAEAANTNGYHHNSADKVQDEGRSGGNQSGYEIDDQDQNESEDESEEDNDSLYAD